MLAAVAEHSAAGLQEGAAIPATGAGGAAAQGELSQWPLWFPPLVPQELRAMSHKLAR